MRSASRVTNPPHFDRQVSAAIGARRGRLIPRIQLQPDAAIRWHLLITKLGCLIDDVPRIDRLLAALVEAPSDQIALFKDACREAGTTV